MESKIGELNNTYVFATDLDEATIKDIKALCGCPLLSDRKIAIMPDAHSNGDGTVTGFTMSGGNRIFLFIERDAGCGVRASKLSKIEGQIDFKRLDDICHQIPAGRGQFYLEPAYDYDFSSLRCSPYISKALRYPVCLGSLGGGNHFIELSKDEEGEVYLIVHNGLGSLSIAMVDYYKNLACKKKGIDIRDAKIEDLVLEGEDKDDFLSDVDFFVKLCSYNRAYIENHILSGMGYKAIDTIDICHHYTDKEDGIIRHGAISAKKGERVIIPINAKEGCIIGEGKGNSKWNYSAPHGGGRLYSRKQARNEFQLSQYQKEMEGIYTSSVLLGNIDEIPLAYRSMDTIMEAIKDTVKVTHILKPLYSYKGI